MRIAVALSMILVACAGNGSSGGASAAGSTTAVASQIAALEQEIADLQAANQDLEARVGALEAALETTTGTLPTTEPTSSTGTTGTPPASSGSGTRFFDDVLFQGDAPAVWTELDLGAWTNGARALVILQTTPVEAGAGISPRFRELGSALTPVDGLQTLALLGTESTGLVLVETDDHGEVEWSDPQGDGQEIRVRAVIQ